MNTNTKCVNYLQLVPKLLATTVHIISGIDLALRWYHLYAVFFEQVVMSVNKWTRSMNQFIQISPTDHATPEHLQAVL